MKKVLEMIVTIILAVLLVSMIPEALLEPFTILCGTIVLVYCFWVIIVRLKRAWKES